MEYNWERLQNQKWTADEGVNSALVAARHQVTIIETIVGITENGVMRSVVFRELDNSVGSINCQKRQ